MALEPDNVKALLRRGRARLQLRDSDGALQDLTRRAPPAGNTSRRCDELRAHASALRTRARRVQALEPGNADAERELRAVAALRKREDTAAKATFAKMFG